MSEATKLNIFQRLLAITDEIEVVEKNLKVETGNGRVYKAVSELDVLNAVKPLEKKHGVYSYPASRLITESKETTTKNGTTNQFMRVETVYRFVNVDTPNEYIDITTYGDGVDSQDKAPGKAMTYADKYALLKAYKIMTGDDPDKDASEEQKTVKETPATEAQVETIKKLLDYDADKIQYVNDAYKVSGLLELTVKQASEVIQKIKDKQAKQK